MFCCQVFVLHGASKSSTAATAQLLKQASEACSPLIALLDPDVAGRQSRTVVDACLPGKCLHAFIPVWQATAPQAVRLDHSSIFGVCRCCLTGPILTVLQAYAYLFSDLLALPMLVHAVVCSAWMCIVAPMSPVHHNLRVMVPHCAKSGPSVTAACRLLLRQLYPVLTAITALLCTECLYHCMQQPSKLVSNMRLSMCRQKLAGDIGVEHASPSQIRCHDVLLPCMSLLTVLPHIDACVPLGCTVTMHAAVLSNLDT